MASNNPSDESRPSSLSEFIGSSTSMGAGKPLLKSPSRARSIFQAVRDVGCSLTGILFFGLSIVLLFVLLFIEVPILSEKAQPLFLDPPTEAAEDVAQWLDKNTVVPVMCHSHNDYWRPHPIVTALLAGCVGIEADVWLTEDGQDLIVGHNRASANKTLKDMYLDPLLSLLDYRNPGRPATSHTPQEQAHGIFSTRPDMTVVLMIDVKENATVIWPIIIQQLETFRQKTYLLRFEGGTLIPGPLVVVGSGALNSMDVLESYQGNETYHNYHDTFLDAPLGKLSVMPECQWIKTYNSNTSYYASISFKVAVGSAKLGFSKTQREKLRTLIHAAEKGGLYSRFWDIPDWPLNYRDYIWDILTQEGVGMLNADDVGSAAQRRWTTGYFSSVVCMIALACVFAAVVVFAVGFCVLSVRAQKQERMCCCQIR